MDNKINETRLGFENLGKNYEKADNVSISKEIIEHVDCYWFRNQEELNSNKIVIYLHGGGFVLGSIQSHQALVSHLAKHLSLPVLFVDYSLAPEKPYPNAVNEVLRVYDYLLHQHPVVEIVFMGDSAGGGLAVSVISKINERGIQPPKIMVLISPWIDLSCTNESYITNANSDPVLTKKLNQDLAYLYIGDYDLSEVNPIEKMFGQFPPTLTIVGSGEILIDDSKAIYNKIISQQPKTKLSIYNNQTHVWILKNIHTEESQRTIKEIDDFIKQ
jgi:epsilon-lactone hydrolase